MYIAEYEVVDLSTDFLDGDDVGFFVKVNNLLDPTEKSSNYSICTLNSLSHGQCILIQLSGEHFGLHAAEYLLVDVPLHVIQAARGCGLVITDFQTGLSLKFKAENKGALFIDAAPVVSRRPRLLV